MSSLADVVDSDRVASFSPLRLDYTTGRVRGAAAILRRILYRWCTLKGTIRHAPDVGLVTPLLGTEGSTWSPAQLAGLKAALGREAQAVNFVLATTISLTLTASGKLIIEALVTLVDGRDYALEVSAGAAGAAIIALGGQ